MIRQLILSFATRGAVALINFAIFLLLTNYLGAAGYGQISMLILNVAIIHAACEIFTGSSLVHFLARSPARRVYLYGLAWIGFSVCFMVLLMSALAPEANAVRLHLLILAFMAALHAFHGILLLARERLRKYQFSVFCFPFFLLICLASLFSGFQPSFNGYLLAFYIAISLSVICSAIMCWPELKEHGASEGNFRIRPALANGFMNQLGNLFHILSNRLSYYVLAAAATVGLYAGATSLAESIWIISGSISPLVLSRIASQRITHNNDRLTLLMAKLSFLCSLAAVLLIAVIPAWVFTEVIGKDFASVKNLILLLSPGILLISFSSIISHYYSAHGKQRILLAANGVGFMITLICVWPLIRWYGPEGACLTAVLSYLGQSLVLLFVFFRETGLPLGAFFTFKKDLTLLGN